MIFQWMLARIASTNFSDFFIFVSMRCRAAYAKIRDFFQLRILAILRSKKNMTNSRIIGDDV